MFLGVPSALQAACYKCKYILFNGIKCTLGASSGYVECNDRNGTCRLYGAPCWNTGGGEDDPPAIDFQDFDEPTWLVAPDTTTPLPPLALSEPPDQK